jgi:hypothetical protein
MDFLQFYASESSEGLTRSGPGAPHEDDASPAQGRTERRKSDPATGRAARYQELTRGGQQQQPGGRPRQAKSVANASPVDATHIDQVDVVEGSACPAPRNTHGRGRDLLPVASLGSADPVRGEQRHAQGSTNMFSSQRARRDDGGPEKPWTPTKTKAPRACADGDCAGLTLGSPPSPAQSYASRREAGIRAESIAPSKSKSSPGRWSWR